MSETQDRRRRDAELLAQCAAGERGAFDVLHREQYRAVVRLAMGIVWDPDEACDVAQEVFVRLLEVAPRWRGRGADPGVAGGVRTDGTAVRRGFTRAYVHPGESGRRHCGLRRLRGRGSPVRLRGGRHAAPAGALRPGRCVRSGGRLGGLW
ncbi:MAG: hypothetical protein KUG77_10435 [Nannocystaceae bacterium]|nr:hypothetical protein [Nannocystaceae bacterium]